MKFVIEIIGNVFLIDFNNSLRFMDALIASVRAHRRGILSET